MSRQRTRNREWCPPLSDVRIRYWLWLVMLAALLGVACGTASKTAGTAASPTPDPKAAAYVALVQAYHQKYVSARGDGYDYCVVALDPPNCRDRGAAMIAVWRQFLKDLDATPAPQRFAADDQTIRAHLPKGIDDLVAMVAAAGLGDKTAMLTAADAYIADMVPTVTDALGDVYAPWQTE